MSPLLETQQAILFLAASPGGQDQLGKEFSEIQEGLRRSKYRDRFSLASCWAVRSRDIQRELLDRTPQIIHFAGQGVGKDGLIFEDDGNVDGAALAGLFSLFADQIQCVVLNGCYSERQAWAIAQHIEFVIGVQGEISHKAALEFVIGFYDALGAGQNIEFAHQYGCKVMRMLESAEDLDPVLIRKPQPIPEPKSGAGVGEQSGKLWRVPELPPHFLPRLELQSLKAQVLDTTQPVVMTGGPQRIGVQGMGGIGKSVLATALAREPEIQQAFPDGIFWVTVGIEPLLVTQQADLAEALSGEKPTFSDVNQGKEQLRQFLAERSCLVILDDVWQLGHADAFNALGAHSRLLITTRDGELVTGLGADPYRLDVLSDEQSLQLLAAWAGVAVTDLPEVSRAVAKECGNLPLALSMCGAMVRDLVPWADLLEALQEADLEFIQKQFAHYPYPDVLKALQVSLESLRRTNPLAAERYQELAVFPADELLPEATVLRFWQHQGNLKPRVARQLLTTLASKSLLRLDGEAPDRQVSLHDLQQDYLRARQTDLQTLHGQLLAAYQPDCPGGWHNGPNDGYFFEHLAYHLVEAGQQSQLQALLFDFRWIRAKLAATDINALLADYERLPEDAELHSVRGALRLSAHVLSQDKRQLQSQLHGRLLSRSGSRLQILLQSTTQAQLFPWLRCLVPSLDPPGGPLLRTLRGHTSYVNDVAVTPDGRYVLSASRDATVKVWELSTGTELHTLSGHAPCGVTDVAVSPDGRYILSASWDKTVKVWELSTGTELRTLRGHTDCVTDVVVSPDGRYVLSSSKDKTVKVWELSTGTELYALSGHTNSVTSVAVTPDGRYVLSASKDKTVKVWDLTTRKELRTFSSHTDSVTSVVVSPDGRYILSASWDNTVKIWELSTGKELRTLSSHTLPVTSVAVSPDGRYVLSTSKDYTVKVWELDTGKELRTLSGHTSLATSVTVSPDGRYVLSASWDKTVKVWELSIDKELRTLSSHTDSVTGVAVSPDGRYVLSASWDKTVKVWELDTGKQLRTLSNHILPVNSIAVSPDGHYVLSDLWDVTVEVWELSTGKEICTLSGHTGWITSVAVSPDGRYILSASHDNTLKVWKLNTGKKFIDKELRTLSGHTSSVTGIAVSPDSHYVLSASWDKTVKIWELSTGKEICTLSGHTGWITSVAVSPDGRYILSASKDKTVKVWDLNTGMELRTLNGHIGSVTGVAVSPDGHYVLSTSQDETLKVWELSSGQEVASFIGNGALTCCAAAPDGVTFMVGESGGRIHFLRLEGVDSGIGK